MKNWIIATFLTVAFFAAFMAGLILAPIAVCVVLIFIGAFVAAYSLKKLLDEKD